MLDVAGAIGALGSQLPDIDHYEANDGAGAAAPRIYGRRGQRIKATIDYWDDQIDVYSIRLRRGQPLRVTLHGPRAVNTSLLLWKPGTQRVQGFRVDRRQLAARSDSPRSIERIRVRARQTGWYYVEVKISTPGSGKYSLTLRKRIATRP